MPPLEVTVPEPVPLFATVSVYVGGVPSVNVAPTARAALIVTGQVAAVTPAQAPLQPPKVEPAAAVAVSVTTAPLVNVAEQLVPQLTPPLLEVTDPVPVPPVVTVSA